MIQYAQVSADGRKQQVGASWVYLQQEEKSTMFLIWGMKRPGEKALESQVRLEYKNIKCQQCADSL